MHVDPALRAFAADHAAQAGAQGRMLAAREKWRADVADVLQDCEALAAGASFDECRILARMMEGQGVAGFAAGWVAAMAQAMREYPLAQLPFRHSYAGGSGAIHLHRTGRVTLGLLLIEPRAATMPATIAFTDCERREIVLGGRGKAVLCRLREGRVPERQPLSIEAGATFACGASTSRAVVALDEPLVLLRVARDPVEPMPTREVELASGQVVHRASPSPAEGRAELAAALLGAMGRSDAAPVLARYACGQAGQGARWEALRNALALDTAAGFEALCGIAAREEDALASDAAALRDHLSTRYPQIANYRTELCLAN